MYRVRSNVLSEFGAGFQFDLCPKNCIHLGLRLWGLGSTWTLKVCKIMAFMATLGSLGLLFHILLGFR